jgi:hypothetical protein
MGVSFNDWLHAFWDEVMIPHSLRNARVGIAWMYTESGDPDGRSNTGRWNPLGSVWKLTAQTAPSGIASTDFNSVPVQNYATLHDGLYATKRTLLQDAHGFPLIVARLRTPSVSSRAVMKAIEQSDWGTEPLIEAVYKDIVNGAYWDRANTLVSGS